ncbi:tail fiber domain-containing protein [Xanthomarina sp. GH4-25]|uniref:tail fiber domain-containing protein n=1 Tax=Xanthomarina sp. GH4-25 TaxID=3349335 RepID=UPI003877E0A8
MKHLITLLITLLISVISFAQQAINYKAIIKDNLGNVIANQTIDVQLAILEGTTNVYQETHAPTTDAHGLIVLNIGEGTTSDDFSSINWGTDDHFLNVQIDTGSGLVDLGSTQFMAVPYALYAETSGSGGNATGLEALDEGNGIGWRIVGTDATYYNNIGNRAVDLSYGGDAGYDAGLGAYGTGSVAMGQYTSAGNGSVAMGYNSTASGQYATAMGNVTTASGLFSTTAGFYTTASAPYSTAFGSSTIADDQNSLVLGIFNDNTTASNTLFQIGNGTNTNNRSNAFVVDNDGIITAPSFDIAEITDDKALITKEFADANYSGGGSGSNPTGLEALDEGNGIGWRMIGRNSNNYGSIGLNSIDVSFSDINSTTNGATGNNSFAVGRRAIASGNTSTALGMINNASGDYSTAMGRETIASNDVSTAMGFQTTASESYSTAMGYGTLASGSTSTAIGSFTVASGINSTAIGETTNASSRSATAMGRGTIADDIYSTVVGTFNDNTTSTTSLFQVGNGGSTSTRSNAFNIDSNGAITAPSLDISEITDDKALITKEYLEVNASTATGLEAIDEGNGIGWRLKGRDPEKYGNIGSNAVDLSYSFYASDTNGALGINSFSIGNEPSATGISSIAMGTYANASAYGSMAFGFNSDAAGENSVAIGVYANASASNSMAFGYGTIADDYYSTVIGRYNDANISSQTLFQVGNGTGTADRSNVITVLQNGYTSVGKHNEEPTTDFQVYHDNGGTENGFKLLNKGANKNWWRFYTLNSNGSLYLYSKAGGNTNPVGSFNSTSGVYSALSDRRVKDNFKDLYFNWQNFMQLKPLTYHYNTDKNNQSQIGFVAQDVESIYPELVNYNKEVDLYQLNYSGFGVVAIKAIQELKKEVKSLSEENIKLKTLLANQNQASTDQAVVLQTLLDRVEALEKNTSNTHLKLVKN